MEKDMTSGSPLKLIFWFSIPVLLGNIFQQFYNMADAIIVGRLLGEDALAAVGATGSIMFLVLYFAIGIAPVSYTHLCGRFIGMLSTRKPEIFICAACPATYKDTPSHLTLWK